MRLQGKVALITGGGGGIGRETALLFAQEGAQVVVVETAAAVEAQGGEAVYVHADVASAADCAAMVEAAEKRFGKLNVLFNNAGIMHNQDDDAKNNHARKLRRDASLKQYLANLGATWREA